MWPLLVPASVLHCVPMSWLQLGNLGSSTTQQSKSTLHPQFPHLVSAYNGWFHCLLLICCCRQLGWQRHKQLGKIYAFHTNTAHSLAICLLPLIASIFLPFATTFSSTLGPRNIPTISIYMFLYLLAVLLVIQGVNPTGFSQFFKLIYFSGI